VRAGQDANASSTKEKERATESKKEKAASPPRGKILQSAGKQFGGVTEMIGGPDRDLTDDLLHAMECILS